MGKKRSRKQLKVVSTKRAAEKPFPNIEQIAILGNPGRVSIAITFVNHKVFEFGWPERDAPIKFAQDLVRATLQSFPGPILIPDEKKVIGVEELGDGPILPGPGKVIPPEQLARAAALEGGQILGPSGEPAARLPPLYESIEWRLYCEKCHSTDTATITTESGVVDPEKHRQRLIKMTEQIFARDHICEPSSEPGTHPTKYHPPRPATAEEVAAGKKLGAEARSLGEPVPVIPRIETP